MRSYSVMKDLVVAKLGYRRKIHPKHTHHYVRAFTTTIFALS